MLALFAAKRAGLLKPQYWMRNIVSGSIVGVVALPLAMAFAIASGAQPEQGIYTAIIAGLFVSIFGGSRLQIAGPTGAFIVVLSGITAKYGINGLQIATIMAGFILLIFGLFRMGSIIKFIPDPVIVGFTSGIGIIIWIGQWKDFFGLPEVSGQNFYTKLLSLLQLLPHMHATTTALAMLSLLLVIYSSKIPGFKHIPGPMIALIAGTLLQYLFEFDGVRTIGSAFGGIPQGLPGFQIPTITKTQFLDLIGPAFTIAMLGAIESLLSAVVADGMVGTRHDSNQELIGQGMANIISPLFGGFAATGAIARTATNIRNGGTSPLSGIVHALTLLLILLILAPVAVHIPLATLAAILFVVAWNMSEAPHFLSMVRRAPRADTVILLSTFTLTIFSDLIIAVTVGILLAILHFLRQMSNSLEVTRTTQKNMQDSHPLEQLSADTLVFTVEGPLFFGAVDKFERALAATHADSDLKTIVIQLKFVPFIDITGIQTLEEVMHNWRARHIQVRLSGANARVTAKLKKAGILGHYDDNH